MAYQLFFCTSGSGCLPSGGVNRRLAFEQELRDRDDLIPVCLQALDDARERLGRVLGSVVEQHDAPRLHPREHPLCDLIGREPLPVEGVAFLHSLKPLEIKDFLKIPRVHNMK